MILDAEIVKERLDSPDNLMNQLNSFRQTKPSNGLFNPNMRQPVSTGISSVPPNIDDLVDSVDDKIKLHSIKGKAVDVLDKSLTALSGRINEVDKPGQIAEIAEKMSRIINGKDNSKDAGRVQQQLIVWQPILVQENHYEHIEIAE